MKKAGGGSEESMVRQPKMLIPPKIIEDSKGLSPLVGAEDFRHPVNGENHRAQ